MNGVWWSRLKQSECEEFNLQRNRKFHPAEHKGTNLQNKSFTRLEKSYEKCFQIRETMADGFVQSTEHFTAGHTELYCTDCELTQFYSFHGF